MTNLYSKAAASIDTPKPHLPPLEATPFCTIVVPTFNEEDYIEDVLRAATSQTYPAGALEILVVDGRSTDRTREIVHAFAARDSRVMLVDNPARLQAAGMNEAIRHARGKVIVRLDAHAEFAPDYVEKSVEALRRTGAWNVGGAARARFKNRFQRALCTALGSKLGVGGSDYRHADREGFVESVWGGAFRREAFDLAGLYDAHAPTNEDAELNQRIIEQGGKVFLSREIVAYYYPRSSLAALAKQYFKYGEGRARTLKKRGRLLSLRPLVPWFMVSSLTIALLLALFVRPSWPLFAAGLVTYATLILIESVRLSMRSRFLDLPRLLLIFPTMHVAHGLGVWRGFARASTIPSASETKQQAAA